MNPPRAMPPPRRALHAAGHTGPDPRASMVLAAVGLVVAVVLGFVISAVAGALAVAATLLTAGIWRAVAPKATRAAGIAVRSKWFDVVTYLALAVLIAALTLLTPGLY